MLSRTDSAGTTQFVWDGMDLVMEFAPDGTQTRYYVVNGELLMFERTPSGGSSTTYQVLCDHVGNVRKVLDSSNSIVATFDYDSLGNLLPSSSDSVPNGGLMYRFSGCYGVRWEPATGLYYMRQRWYDPQLGRFLSVDLVASTNRYAYANNRPTGFVDPFGMAPCPCDDGNRDNMDYVHKHLRDFGRGLQLLGMIGTEKGLELAVAGEGITFTGGGMALTGVLAPEGGVVAGAGATTVVSGWVVAGGGLLITGAGSLVVWMGKSSTSGGGPNSGYNEGLKGVNQTPWNQSYARIRVPGGGGKYRIPDIWELLEQVMGDIKNALKVGCKRDVLQFKDFVKIFNRYKQTYPDLTFEIWVPSNATFTNEILEVLDQLGENVHLHLLKPK
jgi:RHS repeat-associated protein